MPSNETEHPLSYRQEIVGPLFAEIARGDSCAVVGAASMGKSRLLSFVGRRDVREHYLGSQAGKTLLAHVDCNRLAEMSDWGLYELMLTSLTEAAGAFAPLMDQRKALNGLRREVIINHDVIPLLAQRHVELAAHIICAEEQLSVCFLLDEFEEPYRRLPARACQSARAARSEQVSPDLCSLLPRAARKGARPVGQRRAVRVVLPQAAVAPPVCRSRRAPGPGTDRPPSPERAWTRSSGAGA